LYGRIVSLVELRPPSYVLTIGSLARDLGASRAVVLLVARQLIDAGAVSAVMRDGPEGSSLLGIMRPPGPGR
jgi:hypothetical protein